MRLFTDDTRRTKLVLLITTLGFFTTSIASSQTNATDGDVGSPKLVIPPKTPIQFQSKTEFLRMKAGDSGEPLALQTAITRFRPKSGDAIIDLIGAVHIGEAEYYTTLNKQFELYDVVLYELVAPQGTRVPKGGKKGAGNPLSFLQQSAQRMLGLESQLAKIDYQKENFTHADMSPTEMSKKMDERGETPLTVGLSALSEMLRNQNKMANEKTSSSNPIADQIASESIFELMGNPLKMKTMMAQQFTETGVMENGLGTTLNRMLIVDRNSAALKVLQKELAKGKQKIAIFYGAAHMPDFEKRLVGDLGMKRTQQVWIDAWDLTNAPPSSPSNPSQILLRLLKQMDN